MALIENQLYQASLGFPAEFEISRFVSDFSSTCTATELDGPNNYTVNDSG